MHTCTYIWQCILYCSPYSPDNLGICFTHCYGDEDRLTDCDIQTSCYDAYCGSPVDITCSK